MKEGPPLSLTRPEIACSSDSLSWSKLQEEVGGRSRLSRSHFRTDVCAKTAIHEEPVYSSTQYNYIQYVLPTQFHAMANCHMVYALEIKCSLNLLSFFETHKAWKVIFCLILCANSCSYKQIYPWRMRKLLLCINAGTYSR